MKKILIGLLLSSSISGFAQAQNLNDVRWKTEAQVRQILGEPNDVSRPVGTHATYVMWKYDDFTVAFANSRAFHMFRKDSLKKIVLEENR